MSYLQYFQRNIGLFTEAQQQRLRSAAVAIMGPPADCAAEAMALARLGIGELRMVINEQFVPGAHDVPAARDGLVLSDAASIEMAIRDINPFITVRALPLADMATAAEELCEFVRGCLLSIDCQDHPPFILKTHFARAARQDNLVNIAGHICNGGVYMFVFDPGGLSIEDFFQVPDGGQKQAFSIPPPYLPRLKDGESSADVDSAVLAGARVLKAGLISSEAAMLLTGLRRPQDLIFAPRAVFFDAFSRRFEILEPPEARRRGAEV